MTTPKLVMPELSVSQASKEITHNEALAILDQLVMPRVADKDLATPPGSPTNGVAYIVAGSPTGAWTGHTNKIAYWLTASGVWQFLTPSAGWEVWVTDESVRYRYNGSAWVVATTAFTGGTLTSALNEAPIVTLASAATVNIGAAAANTISISGSATISAFDSIASGAVRRLVFQGALTLTHNGTSLILPGAANITTTAGDVVEFVSLGSGNWRCTGYEKTNGTTVALAPDKSPTFKALTLSDGQINFPATQVPSANANTLDDYEEGTWTPVLTFATPGDLSVAYTVQIGSYTKIGRLVNTTCRVLTSSFTHTTSSGACQVTGLPFTPTITREYGAVFVGGITKANYTSYVCETVTSQTYIRMGASGSGQNATQINAADMPSGGTVTLNFSMSYTAD